MSASLDDSGYDCRDSLAGRAAQLTERGADGQYLGVAEGGPGRWNTGLEDVRGFPPPRHPAGWAPGGSSAPQPRQAIDLSFS